MWHDIRYDLNVLFAALATAALIQLIRTWQRGEWVHPDWTRNERFYARMIRKIIQGSIAAVWLIAFATVAWWPELISMPKLLNKVAAAPLELTALMFCVAGTRTLEGNRKRFGFVALLLATLIVSGIMLSGAFAVMMNVGKSLG
jgi:hypothetical protein